MASSAGQGIEFRRRENRGNRSKRRRDGAKDAQQNEHVANELRSEWQNMQASSSLKHAEYSSSESRSILRAPKLAEYEAFDASVSSDSEIATRDRRFAGEDQTYRPVVHGTLRNNNMLGIFNEEEFSEYRSSMEIADDGDSVLPDIDVDSDDSAGSAWEREQLRRAGHGANSMKSMSKNATVSRLQSIWDEEARGMGGRGEMGSSVALTCLAALNAAAESTKRQILKVTGNVEAVENSLSRGDREQDDISSLMDDAKCRFDFYGELLQFLKDVTDMLLATSDSTVDSVNSEMDRLVRLARERSNGVDEYGRVRRSTWDECGDGFQSPPTVSEGLDGRSELVALGEAKAPGSFENAEDVVLSPSAREFSHVGDKANFEVRDSAVDDPSILISRDLQNFPSREVEEQYKSISGVIDKFSRWRELFPSDYKAAFGDLLLGKLCGAVALARQLSKQTNWLMQLPSSARGAAVMKSRVVSWTAIRIAAEWEPRSKVSSESFGTMIGDVLRSLSEHRVERELAVATYGRVVEDVVEWKLAEFSVMMSGAHDREWVCNAAIKFANGIGRIATTLMQFEMDSCCKVEDAVVSKLLGGVLSWKAMALCDDNFVESKKNIELSTLVVELGCCADENGASDHQALVEFPRRSNQLWGPVQAALRNAQKIATERGLEHLQKRIRACLRRVGAA